MAKFMILYNSTQSSTEAMESATPEEMQASMAEWMAWRDNAEKSSKVDFGLPLQAVSRVTGDGAGGSDSQVSGYSFIEIDSKDAALELIKTHPHLKRPGAYIDVLELLPMPGLNMKPEDSPTG